MKERYTQEEANEILRLAIERQPLGRDVTREQLESLAAEVGVSIEAVRAAEAQWAADSVFSVDADAEDRAAYAEAKKARQAKITAFVIHLSLFLWFAFIFAMIAIDENDFRPIAAAFLVPWTLILGLHGARVGLTGMEDEEVAFRRWQKVRRERLEYERDSRNPRRMIR